MIKFWSLNESTNDGARYGRIKSNTNYETKIKKNEINRNGFCYKVIGTSLVQSNGSGFGIK